MVLLKIFLPLATFFAVAFSLPFEDIYEIPDSVFGFIDYAGEMLNKRLDNNSTRYRVVVQEAHECYDREFFNGNRSMCHSIVNNFQRCSQPLVDYFVDWLPEKSKDLPPTIVKGAIAILETYCTSGGEILLEGRNPCIDEYYYVGERNKTIKEECDRQKFKSRLHKLEDELLSKSEFCQIARDIGDCWQDYVNENCKNSMAKEFFSKFYNAALSACTK